MDFSKRGLQKLFAGTFGRKWRSTIIHQTKQFDITDYDIQDMSGGYLNRVYRFCSQKDHSHSVIVKHAPPYIKCLGLEQPLGEQRIHIEYCALKRFNQALPGSVPEAYFYDDDTKCVVMEDLKSYEAMIVKLPQGNLDIISLARQLANIVAKLHRNTHIKTVSTGEFQTLLATFSNDEMVAFNSDLTFTGMVDPNNPTNRCSPELTMLAQSVREDPVLLDCVHALYTVFLEQKECLTHGDLHLGSVMVNECDAKVIDAEFAFMGPAGADIGMILAHYIFTYAAHTLYPTPENPSFSNLVQEAMMATVDVYFDEAKAYLSDEDLATLVSHTAGFTGCHVIKWMIGIAEARDLLDKPQAELMCLNIGVRLTKEYQTIRSPRYLVQCILG